jgi:hypothetical protein
MQSRKPRIQWTLAFLFVLSALAVLAPAAHASGEWKIAGEQLSELEVEEATLLGSASKAFSIDIPWYATTIECETLSLPSASIYPAGEGVATLRLTNCSLSGPPFVAETCKLIEPLDLQVGIALVEHKSSVYALFEPKEEGKPIATVSFKKGTECPLPLSNSLKGSFVGTTEATEQIEQPVTFDAATSELFSEDSLTFGSHPATLAGKATLDLWSIYKGEKWAASKAEPEEPEGEPEIEGSFRVNGTTLIGEAGVEGTIGAGALSVPGSGMELSCSSGSLSGTLQKGGAASGSAAFQGCKVVGNKFCTVYPTEEDLEKNKSSGYIFASGTGQLVQWGGRHFLAIQPSGESSVLADIWLDGSLCTLPEEGELGGSLAVELPGGLEELVDHATTTVTSWLEAELGTGLLFEEEPAVPSGGEATVGLLGEYLGEKWSVF